ncbi:Uncharacterized protein APZ42_021334 [Daphnia magna]|uniref:Uncharacterized protein n=1 Tax=Daphnia magna TaxID=35525 RepID=A0A164WRX2_9CRUS|nr:Uncharacterized protein APZ42_021334 [Daphnia magna]
MDYALVKRAKKAAIKEDETLKKLAVQLSRQGLTEQDLPGILKKLQQLAKDKKNNEANPEDFKNQGKEVACEEEALVTTGKNKDKILPNSYKVDHEGQFMIAAWARKMMNKYGDTTSERDKFRFKMQEANRKATALMLLINEQSQFKITQEMYGTGSFPWNETTENIHSRLQDDIGINTAIVDGWQDSSLHQDSSYPEWIQVSRGKLVLINAELDRLKWKVGRAIKLFRRYTYGDPDEQEYDCDSQHYSQDQRYCGVAVRYQGQKADQVLHFQEHNFDLDQQAYHCLQLDQQADHCHQLDQQADHCLQLDQQADNCHQLDQQANHCIHLDQHSQTSQCHVPCSHHYEAFFS